MLNEVNKKKNPLNLEIVTKTFSSFIFSYSYIASIYATGNLFKKKIYGLYTRGELM